MEAASTRRSELDRLEPSLRARFEDIKGQERQPNEAESERIHADLACTCHSGLSAFLFTQNALELTE